MNRPLAGIVLLAALSASAQEDPVFRAGVSLVRLDAEVTDGTRTLTGYRKEDFRVLDNGQPRDILHLSVDEEPLDLILLFDVSGSMRPNVAKVIAAARGALAEHRPDDRIAVMVFNRNSRIVAPFTGDFDAVERTLSETVLRMKFGGGTHILAAVDDAALYFLREPKSRRRRAVLIFTDDFGVKTRSEKTVVTHFWEADALLSGVIIRDKTIAAIHKYSRIIAPQSFLYEKGMTGVADKTGGDALNADDPGQGFREMMHRIRLRYSIYYAMPEGTPGEHRKVQVELSPEARSRNTEARIRVRKGYTLPDRSKNSSPDAP